MCTQSGSATPTKLLMKSCNSLGLNLHSKVPKQCMYITNTLWLLKQ